MNQTNQIIFSEKDLNTFLHKKVVGILSEVMSDPDFGLELQDWVKKRLKSKPRSFVSSSEIKKKYL